jgi:hypothetical protein
MKTKSMDIDTITKKQFKQYVKVQKSGLFNMWSREAIEMSKLSEDSYLCVLRNFRELTKKYGTKN